MSSDFWSCDNLVESRGFLFLVRLTSKTECFLGMLFVCLNTFFFLEGWIYGEHLQHKHEEMAKITS
jgi:hypothetical protein